jgi:NAD(P)-dependent dehydrogenase (short-subunit alcohol dehydrogenase family)
MGALSGKVAFVTGAASGIGKALVEALAGQGAAVVVADRNGPGAEAVARALTAGGAQAEALALDVTDAEAVERAVADVWTRKGAIDLFFNNAGIGGPFGEMTDMKLADWRKVLDVNLYGVIHGVAAVYPRMVKRRSGHIINTASAAGLVPSPWSGPYTTAKHAVVGLTHGLRTEATGNGVRVSAVCPGFIDTNLFQQSTTYETVSYEKAVQLRPPLMNAAACAKAILKGVAANRPIITVTPVARLAWWLWRLWPGLVFWVAQKQVQRLRALR